MARIPQVSPRIDPALMDAARQVAGMDDATSGEILRFALAKLIGHPDPRSVAKVKTGRPPRARAT